MTQNEKLEQAAVALLDHLFPGYFANGSMSVAGLADHLTQNCEYVSLAEKMATLKALLIQQNKRFNDIFDRVYSWLDPRAREKVAEMGFEELRKWAALRYENTGFDDADFGALRYVVRQYLATRSAPKEDT